MLILRKPKSSTIPPRCITFQQVSRLLELLALSVKGKPTADFMGGGDALPSLAPGVPFSTAGTPKHPKLFHV